MDTGLVLIKNSSSNDWITIVVTGGFALVNNNVVTILVNEAELGSEINIQKAEEDFIASKAALENNTDIKRNFELTSQFKKARARFQVGQSLKTII